MKAILCPTYGPPDVITLVDIPKPTPKPNEVLVKIIASTVTFGDCEIRNLLLPAWTRFPVRLFFGYSKPRRLIPGMEYAGIVEAVGSNVTNIKVNDEIFGSTGMSLGGNAEYICRPATDPFGFKPANASFDEVATIPVGGINAFHFLDKASIQPRQKVLVIGAGGSIGTWAVLLAKNIYDAEVTAVDHTDKLQMLRDIGADHVIDYTKEDFSAREVKYDVVLDIVYKTQFSKVIRVLNPDGFYLMSNTGPLRMLRGLWTEWISSKKMKFSLAAETEKNLNYLASLIAGGKIKPVIDRRYPLEQTKEAHRYVEHGLKKGSVIIEITSSPASL